MSSPVTYTLAAALAVSSDGASAPVEIAGLRRVGRVALSLSEVTGGVMLALETSQDGSAWSPAAQIASGEAKALIVTCECGSFVRAAWSVPAGASARISATVEAHQCYALLSDLRIPAGALTPLSESQRLEKLLEASSIADGPLAAAGLVLPLVSWGDDLRGAVATIATAECLIGRGFNPERGDAAIVDLAEARRKWLERIGDGGLISPATQGTPPMPEALAEAVVVSQRRRGW